MKNLDLAVAYAAGFLDGEGCFFITRVRRTDRQYESYRYVAGITVTSTNREVLRWLQEQFGGSLSSEKIAHSRPTEEVTSQWHLHTRKAMRELLPMLIPLLIVKKLQATVLLNFCQVFWETSTNSKRSEEELAIMERYWNIMKLANSKGPGSNDVKSRLLSVVGEGP